MPGVRQKPVETLAFKRGGRGSLAILPAPPASIPAPPDGVGDVALGYWKDFFQTDVSGAVNMKRDGRELRKWCRLVDAIERFWPLYLEAPLIPNRYEGMVPNPLFSQIMRMEAEIDRLSSKYGMTPLDKMRMTGALDQAERAEKSIKARREGRRPAVA